MIWDNISKIPSKNYICGYCGNTSLSQVGYTSDEVSKIYICYHCSKPTFFANSDSQTPEPYIKSEIAGISDESVKKLYEEICRSYSAKAYTVSVLGAKKLIMNIAVSKGAEENKLFIQYVEYLWSNYYIHPAAREWTDQVKDIGNDAAHEIKLMMESDAKNLIHFIEMLLKIIYDFPSRIKKRESDNA